MYIGDILNLWFLNGKSCEAVKKKIQQIVIFDAFLKQKLRIDHCILTGLCRLIWPHLTTPEG